MKIFSLISIAFASALSLSIATNPKINEVKATSGDITKTISFGLESNILSMNASLTDACAFNSQGEQISFSFSNLSHVSRGAGANWQTFYASSYLQNTTVLPSLLNISLTFLNASESTIDIFWGWDGANETYTGYTISCNSLTASFDFNGEKPSYFKIVPSSEISCTGMELTYGVETTDDIYGTLPYLTYSTLSDGTINVSKVTNTSLTTIYIPEYIDGKEVTKINSGALSNCGQLERLIIPFVGNTKAKDITANASANIFIYIFNSPSGEDYVPVTQTYKINTSLSGSDTTNTRKISKKLTYLKVLSGDLGYGSLSGITTINTVELGNHISSTIPIGTFYKSNINFLRLPSHLTTFYAMAFKDSHIDTLFLSNSYKEWAVKSFSTDTSVPVRYSSSTLFNGESVTEMHFNDIEKISSYAFYGLHSLTKLTIDGAVANVLGWSFAYCDNLIEAYIDIDGSVQWVFQYCSSLTKCVISNRVTGLSGQMFAGCSSLEEIRLPFIGAEKKTSIYGTSFYTLGFLFGTTPYENSIECGQSYCRENYSGFGSASSEYKYQIPASLKKIYIDGSFVVWGAFRNMTMIEEVILGDNVTSIESNSFQNCTGLKHLHIGKSVKSISGYAFSGSLIELITVDSENEDYQSLDNGKILYNTTTDYLVLSYDLVIPEGTVEFSNSIFAGNTEIETVYIPASVKKIPDEAFKGCSNLKNVIFADNSNLERIGGDAFRNCTSLQSITLPRSLQYLGSYAVVIQ